MKLFILLTSSFLLLLTGCKKKGCMESGGDTTRSARNAAPFSEIHAYDNINIVLKQDTAEAISIEAGSNLQPYIKAVIENNVLTFHNNSGCSWLRSPSENITAYVSVKSLARMNLYGSGSITASNTITSPDFTIDAYQAASSVKMDIHASVAALIIRDEDADYTLSGDIGYATIYCGQKGTMDLRNLHIQDVDLDQRSIRNMYVWVTGTFLVKVEYKGNVYYKGNPDSLNYRHFNDGRLLPLQ